VERRLTTVLFLDIVGSTSIASQIGDRRWRELLSRFRQIVRKELKRFEGHEEDTAGDGFLATFDKPARAVAGAVAIAGAVQQIGLEVRSGVHTGECEELDGKLAGIAVHLAARVMSLAGPAEIFITGTVKDLAIGAGIEVREAGVHELKGVPGAWHIFDVTALNGVATPSPIPEAEAGERIASVEPRSSARRRRNLIAAAGVTGVALIIGAVVLFAPAGPPVTLVRIDAKTNTIVQTLHDRYYSHHLPNSLFASSGSLWQYAPGIVVRRDPRNGSPQLTIPVAKNAETGTPGFGSVWIAARSGPNESLVVRYDEASGRQQARVAVPDASLVSMSAGNGALWALSSDGKLAKIDPLTNTLTQVFRTPTQAPGVVVAVDGYVWICDCEAGHLIQFDPGTGQKVHDLHLAEHGYLVDAETPADHTLWMIDPNGNTLTPLQPASGATGQPLGFGGHLGEAAIGYGALWVAAADAVYRIDLKTHSQRKIDVPMDMTAGSVAVDEQSGSVWIGNCGCPRNG
jgi:class 3 adenylate cyclase/streptogramin lyase